VQVGAQVDGDAVHDPVFHDLLEVKERAEQQRLFDRLVPRPLRNPNEREEPEV
jgi:hypothetical protein